MPKFWRSWLYQLDPFTRLIGGMVTTALHQLPVNCKPWEFNAFTAPSGMSCGEYMQPFFDAHGPGYLADNSTSSCEYCAYRAGDQFYEPLGLTFGNRWRDLGIFLCFIGSNTIIILVAVRTLACCTKQPPRPQCFISLTLSIEPLPQLQPEVERGFYQSKDHHYPTQGHYGQHTCFIIYMYI